MLKEIQDSYISKYESPIAARAHYAVLDGWGDESTGDSVEWFMHIDRIGRRLVLEGCSGWVSIERFPTVAEAQATFAKWKELYTEFLGDDA